MNFWDSSVITGLTNSVFSSVNKAQYKLSNTWYDCITVSSGAAGDGKYFIFEVPSSVNGTITGIRLIDSSSNALAEMPINVTKSASRGFSFKITFQIKESEED
jgi:hypothetical protein